MRSIYSFAIAGALGLFSALPSRGALFDQETPPAAVDSADGADVCDLGDCCDSGLGGPRFLGLLPSDHCFDRFISPLANPFFFEDPRSLTEARGIFIDNQLPAFANGSHLVAWSGQVRGRITDRWSVIAPRLGAIYIDPAGGDSPRGFVAAPVGLKYNFFRDVERQLLISGGITYFIPGAQNAYSGFGGGDFHFFLTGGKQIFGRGHWLSASGFRIPTDSGFGTQLWYWSNQWDYEFVDHWYGLVGLNWFHWMKNAANNFSDGISGLDILNLPTAGVAGHNVVSTVVGGRWKPGGHFEMGGGYEFPLTNRNDILHNRIYADVIFRY